MFGKDARSAHDLDSHWPAFLDLLDTDPHRALEGIHTFAWKLFEVHPPFILRKLDPTDRQDRIADLVLSCSQDRFRKLRSYRNVGKPFAAWLSTVLVRQAINWLRSRKPAEELTESLQSVEDDQSPGLSGRVVDSLNRCMGQMTEKCRLYLVCTADGMKPRDIALLLGVPEVDNKRISDDLRHCRRRLRELLLAEGVDPDEVTW